MLCGFYETFSDDDGNGFLLLGLLGSVAPCVLYGTNAERLGSAPGTFSNHCLTYSGLYFIGNSLFGWNCLAPWFSYSSRSAIRRKFNLEVCFLSFGNRQVNLREKRLSFDKRLINSRLCICSWLLGCWRVGT